jgi:isoaspartyl peptidase/L-asparaginase-like protein (Ntn-hydrolase superfamily)
MEKKSEKSIDEIFREGTSIDKALKQGVREALLRHKQAGNSIVVWRDGKIVWLKPEEIFSSNS